MMIIDGPVHETRPTAPKTRREKIQKTTINSRTIQIFHYYSPNHVSTLRSSCGRPFVRKFPHRMALVRCPRPSAFRLRRLAQSLHRIAPRVWLALGLRPFACKFPHKVALVQCPSAFLLQFPSAFRLRRLAQSVVRGLGPRHFTCKFSHI